MPEIQPRVSFIVESPASYARGKRVARIRKGVIIAGFALAVIAPLPDVSTLTQHSEAALTTTQVSA